MPTIYLRLPRTTLGTGLARTGTNISVLLLLLPPVHTVLCAGKEFYPGTPSLTTLATRHGLACCFLSFFYTRHGRRGRERPPRTGTNTEKNFTTKLPLAQHSDWARDWRALRKEPSASAQTEPDPSTLPTPGSLLHQKHMDMHANPPASMVCEIMLQSRETDLTSVYLPLGKNAMPHAKTIPKKQNRKQDKHKKH